MEIRAGYTNERQIAIQLIEVQTVAKDEFIGDIEAEIVNRNIDAPTAWLAEQRTDFETRWVAGQQNAPQISKGVAAVHDVLDYEQMLALHILPQIHVDAHYTGRLPDMLTVTGHCHKIEGVRHRDLAGEIAQEDDAAFQHAQQ